MEIINDVVVPRGNTQKQVNQTVVDFLKGHYRDKTNIQKIKHLDLPCGEGQLAQCLTRVFPNSEISAVDLFTDVKSTPQIQFHKMGGLDFLRKQNQEQFDSISCVSGVMCFDGLPELFQHLKKCTKPNGLCVVTNDNVFTVRDRLSFLLFGQLKRFKPIFQKNEGNWNVVLPQALYMFFERENFKNIEIRYTSVYSEDFIFLPLALVIYPFMVLKLASLKSHLTLKQKIELFPFKALLARHYVIRAVRS